MKELLENWNEFLKESVYIDMSSFKPRDTLNPKLWSDEQTRLKPEVRKVLLQIAYDFLDEVKINSSDIVDITVTGSSANYNWTEYSDIDLHIVLDFRQIGEKVSLVKNFFHAKSKLWNLAHEIMIGGHEVELYVQELAEPHASTGVFSLALGRWVKKPRKHKPTIDQTMVHKKANTLVDLIDQIEKHFAIENYDIAHKMAEKVRNKIRNFRKCGLQDSGEYSSENLAFKTLRKNGYLRKLADLLISSYDKSKSFDPAKRDLMGML